MKGKIFGLSFKNFGIIIGLNLLLAGVLFVGFKAKNYVVKVICFVIYFASILGIYWYFPHFKEIAFYLILPSAIVAGLAWLLGYESKPDPIWDVEILTNKGKRFIRNVKRGVLVFGSAGSGKTISIIYPLMKHFAENGFGGIIYDFKDGELTELAEPIFKDKLKVICIHNPSISYRVNPIAPQYIKGEIAVNDTVSVLLDNLINSGVGKGDDFFKDGASSLLASTILNFKLNYPNFCTLPHVISYIIAVDHQQQEQEQKPSFLGDQSFEAFKSLKDFLTQDKRVKIQASTFLMGLGSSRQTASVVSTLASGLRKIAFPESFWILSGNDLNIEVNSPEELKTISIINEPKNKRFLSTINATIIHTITKEMMQRNRTQSFVLLDEAPTIKLLNMADIPATMRSFGVATIYCAQDLSQGLVAYGRDGFKAITSNLSTQFFGKSNDPDTSKFYESYFEIVKEKTKSVSSKGDWFNNGGSTVTTGEKEVSKYRSSRFNNLQVGEFAFLSDGKNDIYKIQSLKIETGQIPKIKEVTEQQIIDNYYKIINEVELLVK